MGRVPEWRWVAVLMCAGACLAFCATLQAAVRVWAVGDGLRIDPHTGKTFEDSEIYPERLRIKPGYKGVDAWLDAEVVRRTRADTVTINALPRRNLKKPIWTAEDTGRLRVPRLSLVEATTKGRAYTRSRSASRPAET